MTQIRKSLLLAVVVSIALAAPTRLEAQKLEPIAYTVRIPAPDSHFVEVEAAIPTAKRPSIELMMPIWSPGYYRVEDYAAQVSDVAAKSPDGKTLSIEKTDKNHWRLDTGGAASVQLSYRVFCNQRSVTTNEVTASYAVLNGAPTFITIAERARRPHEVRIELPAGWTRAMTGLADAPDRKPNHFRAADFETLVDSPILLGDLGVHEFVVSGKRHYIVSVGNTEGWDGDTATRDLQTFVEESQRFWGFLPYDKYLFLLMFRQGGGGLEHKNSNLSTVVARTPPERRRWPSLGLLAHEYFHLFNVKRLRPVELGRFDFDKQPTTGSLWMAEGVTSYYSGLLMTRSGLQTPDEYLSSLSSLIGNLQNSPGRLLQSVEQSSLEVWNNSNSGVNPAATTVSYYNKGNVLGLLLDAKIRRATNGERSFDDVMKAAYRRYSGLRGFTADQFRETAEEIAGIDLKDWFRNSVSSVEELDYADLLECFGLQFTASEQQPPGAWKLVVRDDATAAQKRNLEAWLG